MRAVYSVDPEHGSGYGIIKIYDCENLPEPIFSLKRLPDGKFLSSAGWRDEKVGLSPISSNAFEDGVEFHVGPNIVDELAPELRYQVILPGIVPLPLIMQRPIQSWIAHDGGSGLIPPPPDMDVTIPVEPPVEDTIYEGVEKTPADYPAEDAGGLPSGVASAGKIAHVSGQVVGKKRAWLLWGVVLFVIWIVGGVILWHGAMKNPVAPYGDSAPFVLFPQSHANDEEPAAGSPDNK